MPEYLGSFEDMARDFDSLFEDVDKLAYLEGLTFDAILSLYGARTILDCACGTGIQSLGLAEMGYGVYASDISETMVEILNSKAKSNQVSITTKIADFRTLKTWPSRHFDAVICAGNSLTLLATVREVEQALSSMNRVLKKLKGIVIVGLHNYSLFKCLGNKVLLRRYSLSSKQVEIVLDVRDFGEDTVTVTSKFFRYRLGKWSTRTYTKTYLSLTPKEMYNAVLASGFNKVKFFDIKGNISNEEAQSEWLFVVGEV